MANFHVSSSRNRNRCTLTVTFALLNVAEINATIIYNYNNEIKIKRKIYLKQLGLSLIKDILQTRQEYPNLPGSIRSSQKTPSTSTDKAQQIKK